MISIFKLVFRVVGLLIVLALGAAGGYLCWHMLAKVLAEGDSVSLAFAVVLCAALALIFCCLIYLYIDLWRDDKYKRY